MRRLNIEYQTRRKRKREHEETKTESERVQNFFFPLQLQATITVTLLLHCIDEKRKPRQDRRLVEGKSWVFFRPGLNEPWFLWSGTRVALGSRCEQSPGGHPGGARASSGDKDLEIRNTRGGVGSRDFQLHVWTRTEDQQLV